MRVSVSTLIAALFLCGTICAEEEPSHEAETAMASDSEITQQATLEEGTPEQPRTMSGMSILGNEEAPKSLVIVPWKSSELGDELELTDTLDDRARPVDRDVFMRELHYYEIRSGG